MQTMLLGPIRKKRWNILSIVLNKANNIVLIEPVDYIVQDIVEKG